MVDVSEEGGLAVEPRPLVASADGNGHEAEGRAAIRPRHREESVDQLRQRGTSTLFLQSQREEKKEEKRQLTEDLPRVHTVAAEDGLAGEGRPHGVGDDVHSCARVLADGDDQASERK